MAIKGKKGSSLCMSEDEFLYRLAIYKLGESSAARPFAVCLSLLSQTFSGGGYTDLYFRSSADYRAYLEKFDKNDRNLILSLKDFAYDRNYGKTNSFFGLNINNIAHVYSQLSLGARMVLSEEMYHCEKVVRNKRTVSLFESLRDGAMKSFNDARRNGWSPLLDLDSSRVSVNGLRVLLRNYLISTSPENDKLYLDYLPKVFPFSKNEIITLKNKVSSDLERGLGISVKPFQNGIFLLTPDMLDNYPIGMPGKIMKGSYGGVYFSYQNTKILIPDDGLVLYRKKGIPNGSISSVFGRAAFGEYFDVDRNGYWTQIRNKARESKTSGNLNRATCYFDDNLRIGTSKGIRLG